MAGPTVTSVSPNRATVAGDVTVTITGADFVAVPTITFGGTPATGILFSSSTSLVATVPAHSAGTVDVVVTNPNGQSGTLTDGFIYDPPPTVTSISPTSGTTSGGASVTITGTDFVDGATVTIGGNDATSVTVASATSITATTPAHAAGTVDVVVTNPDSQTGTLAGGYLYVAPPTLTSISPNSGIVAGGYTVTITGADFVTVPSVTFGGTPAATVAFASSTSLLVTVPARSAGTVDVVVTNADGQSGTLTDGFTYVPPPTITSLSPSSASTAGGSSVVITGTDFVSGATVTLGGVAADFVTFISSTSLDVTIPPFAAGTVDVVVTNPDTQSDTLANGLTYLDPATLTSTNWQVDFAFAGGSFRLEVFFEQESAYGFGDTVSGTNRDNNAELDVVTSGQILGSEVTITFTLSNGGTPRGSVTCTGTVSAGSPQTIDGTFTSPTTEAVGGTSGTCILS